MKKSILVKGPALSRSGYGEQTRFALRSLRSREDLFDIFLINIKWGATGFITEDNEERRWLDNLLRKTIAHHQAGGRYDVSLQVTIPNEFEKIAPINIGYTAGIETTKVSPDWVEKAWMMDHLIVVSNHSKDTFEGTKLTARDSNDNIIAEEVSTLNPVPGATATEITPVNYPVRNYKPSELELNLDTDFNFLTVAQWGPRKNLKKTVQWFVDEFKKENVGLVVKANTSKNCVLDRDITMQRMRQVLEEHSDRKCKVYLIHGDMTDEELAGLYSHPSINAYVTLTHGEGYGLPIFEAAYNGLPVLAPDWSGQCDFLHMPVKSKNGKVKDKAMFAKVSYELRPISQEARWKGVLEDDSKWCYADRSSYKDKLREMYKDIGRFESQAKKLQTWLQEEFTEEKKYKEFIDCVIKTCDVDQPAEVVVL